MKEVIQLSMPKIAEVFLRIPHSSLPTCCALTGLLLSWFSAKLSLHHLTGWWGFKIEKKICNKHKQINKMTVSILQELQKLSFLGSCRNFFGSNYAILEELLFQIITAKVSFLSFLLLHSHLDLQTLLPALVSFHILFCCFYFWVSSLQAHL